MKASELQQAIGDIRIPDTLETRLVRNCSKRSSRRFAYRKPPEIALACMLVVAMLVGIPYLIKNPATGDLELVMVDSPLVIRVAAAAADNQLVVEDFISGTEILLGRYSLAMNSVPGFPFFFSYPGTSIELAVDNGQFLLWDKGISIVDGYLGTKGGSGQIERVGNTHLICGEGYVFWVPYTEEVKGLLPTGAVIEYRIRVENHVVGFGIIKIDSKDYSYSAKLLLSTRFPKVEGRYQSVKEEDLEKLKQQVLLDMVE